MVSDICNKWIVINNEGKVCGKRYGGVLVDFSDVIFIVYFFIYNVFFNNLYKFIYIIVYFYFF